MDVPRPLRYAGRIMKIDVRRVTRDPADVSRELPAITTVDLQPDRTAAVICDMWDDHWCAAAAARVAEMAPAVNELVSRLRADGVLIVHAPSETLDYHRDHPARARAESAPDSGREGLVRWMHHDPSREAVLPIDDTDGGCPCSPACSEGRAWSRQIGEIEIHDADVISDSAEIYNVYDERGIENVLIMGVHANMCVLGRPFGIRQSVTQGLRTFFVRDLTDTMYNPQRRPWVDHYTGTDLIVRHVETWWCPTFSSDQILGGRPFRFSGDMRSATPRIVGDR